MEMSAAEEIRWKRRIARGPWRAWVVLSIAAATFLWGRELSIPEPLRNFAASAIPAFLCCHPCSFD